jgi:hypothetical protein
MRREVAKKSRVEVRKGGQEEVLEQEENIDEEKKESE